MRRVVRFLWMVPVLILPVRAETYLILPFFNQTKNGNLDWIGESVAANVREALASEGVLAVHRDDRVEAYRRLSIRPNSHLTKASVVRVGSELDASAVIFGTYDLLQPPASPQQGRGSLRITAQILQLDKLTRGPEYIELGALEDLARLQTHLAWQTLQFVIPERAPSEDEYRRRKPVIRVEAIENYIRGLLADGDQRNKFFSQAVRLEPTYSQANFELGRLNWEKKNFKTAIEHLTRVLPSDSRYREANFLLGLSRYRSGDYAAAEQAFQLVAKEVPLSEVLNNLGAAQSRKNSAQALENFQRALEGDSNDPDYHFNVGYALYKRGDLADAAERFRAVLDRTPEDAQAMTLLGRCLKKSTIRGRDSALESMERLKETYEEGAYLQLKAVLEPKRANN